jgi:hypothetical protein
MCSAAEFVAKQFRIGPLTAAMLIAVVFVSMIADGPMGMAIIISDRKKKALKLLAVTTGAQPCTEACRVNPSNQAARFK